MDDFLALSKSNTEKDLETCGILGAHLVRFPTLSIEAGVIMCVCVYIYILTIESLYLASCMSKDYSNNFKLTFDLPSDIVLKTHFSSVYIIIELAVSCHSEVQITLLNVDSWLCYFLEL